MASAEKAGATNCYASGYKPSEPTPQTIKTQRQPSHTPPNTRLWNSANDSTPDTGTQHILGGGDSSIF